MLTANRYVHRGNAEIGVIKGSRVLSNSGDSVSRQVINFQITSKKSAFFPDQMIGSILFPL